ncbi:hypothetical protein MSG28_014925, partial [Choristoneura fumiferana]
MALPTSFEHPEDYFQDCLAFLKEYQYLYNFPNTDILVHDVLKHIDVQNMQTLEVFHKDFKLPTDLLNNFFEKLSRLTAVHDEFEEVDNLENVVNIPCGVSPKKRHEIAYLANEVKQVCEKNGCDVVVDFGSGLGYLDQIIFETTNLKVLGLECNTSHYVGAKKRQGKYHPNSVENVKYIKHTINENSNVSIEQYLRGKFLNFNGFCVAGLHACADLTVVALDLFLKMTEAKAIIIMPCCYHKMEKVDDRFKNFPLSNCFKDSFESSKGFEFMGVPFLRLGAQPPCCDEDLEDLVFNLISRAVLQLYASKHNCKLKRNTRKAVKTKTMNRNFETYIQDACNGFSSLDRAFEFIENVDHAQELLSNILARRVKKEEVSESDSDGGEAYFASSVVDVVQNLTIKLEVEEDQKPVLSTEQENGRHELPYICAYCGKGFRFKTILNQHVRQHTGVKPYTCGFCQRDFTNWPNYNKHMKRRHGMDMAKKKHTPEGLYPINPATGEVVITPETEDTLEWKKEMMRQRRPGRPKQTVVEAEEQQNEDIKECKSEVDGCAD